MRGITRVKVAEKKMKSIYIYIYIHIFEVLRAEYIIDWKLYYLGRSSSFLYLLCMWDAVQYFSLSLVSFATFLSLLLVFLFFQAMKMWRSRKGNAVLGIFKFGELLNYFFSILSVFFFYFIYFKQEKNTRFVKHYQNICSYS